MIVQSQQLTTLTFLLGFSLIVVMSSGCQILGVHAYYVEGGAPNPFDGQSCNVDQSECVESGGLLAQLSGVPNLALSAIPIPQLPTPPVWARCQEQRNLPDGPEGVKFHPLPTRPMFQPSRPAQADWIGGQDGYDIQTPDGSMAPVGCRYGAIPARSQWQMFGTESVDPQSD